MLFAYCFHLPGERGTEHRHTGWPSKSAACAWYLNSLICLICFLRFFNLSEYLILLLFFISINKNPLAGKLMDSILRVGFVPGATRSNLFGWLIPPPGMTVPFQKLTNFLLNYNFSKYAVKSYRRRRFSWLCFGTSCQLLCIIFPDPVCEQDRENC